MCDRIYVDKMWLNLFIKDVKIVLQDTNYFKNKNLFSDLLITKKNRIKNIVACFIVIIILKEKANNFYERLNYIVLNVLS